MCTEHPYGLAKCQSTVKAHLSFYLMGYETPYPEPLTEITEYGRAQHGSNFFHLAKVLAILIYPFYKTL